MNFTQNERVYHFSSYTQIHNALILYMVTSGEHIRLLKEVRNLLESIVRTLLTYIVRESIKSDPESNTSTLIRCNATIECLTVYTGLYL